MKLLKPKKWNKEIVLKFVIPEILFITALLWVLWLTFYPDSHSFLCEVQTEKGVVTVKERKVSFPIDCDFDVIVDDQKVELETCDPAVTNGNETIGNLDITIGTQIVATRLGNGNITLALETPEQRPQTESETSKFATKINTTNMAMRLDITKQIDDEYEDESIIGRNVQIVISDPAKRKMKGKSFVLSLKGVLSDIEEIDYLAEQVPARVHSGGIYLVNKNVLIDDYYEIGPFDVHPGDGITFDRLHDVTMNVIVSTKSSEPGLQLTVNGPLDGEIGISRFKHQTLYVQASALQKLMNDKLLPLLWSMLAFTFPFVFRVY